MDDALQVFVLARWEHSQAALVAFLAGNELAHNRAVEQRIVFQIPVMPARIFRVGPMFEYILAWHGQIRSRALPSSSWFQR